MGNLTELGLKIFQKAKSVFLLPEDATEAELHEAITQSSEDLRSDVIMGFANQLSELVQAETAKQVVEFTQKLKEESQEVMNSLESKLADLEQKLADLKPSDIDLGAEIQNLRTEFGNQLNEIKLSNSKTTPIAGDGVILSKHESTDKASPTKAFNIIKV